MLAWSVDTSIDLDGHSVDGCRAVSHKALEVILRDEKRLLRPIDRLGDECHEASFF